MINLIHNIFLNHRFEYQTIGNNHFYKQISEEGVAYYWLIVEVESLVTILDDQNNWFKECKSSIEHSDFDKNTSLLVLLERKETREWKNELVRIEDDPFQFKKYIIGYTKIALEGLLENSDTGNPNLITKLIADEEIFNEYKNSYSEYSWHNLLYTISQKLPFLKLNIASEKGLDNLFEESRNRLSALNFFGQFERIDNSITNPTDDISFDDLSSIISKEEE